MKTKNEKSWLYNFIMELILETNPGHDLKCQIKKLESDLKEQSDKTEFYRADNKRLYDQNSELRKSLIFRNATITANKLHIKNQDENIEKMSTKLKQQHGIISQLQSELEAAKLNADKWIAQRERIKGKAKSRRAKAKGVELNEFSMPEDLREFLKSEGILDKVVKYAKAQNFWTIFGLGDAFSWKETKEGGTYWVDMDNKFKEYQQQRKEANNGTK
jgi:chromosome segregation ATPase